MKYEEAVGHWLKGVTQLKHGQDIALKSLSNTYVVNDDKMCIWPFGCGKPCK